MSGERFDTTNNDMTRGVCIVTEPVENVSEPSGKDTDGLLRGLMPYHCSINEIMTQTVKVN